MVKAVWYLGAPFVSAFLVTVTLVPLCMWIARRLSFMDIPDGKVKRHARATPYLGGLAIAGGILAALIFLGGISLAPSCESKILLVSFLLLLLGLFDDYRAITPAQKIVGQFVIAAWYCMSVEVVYLPSSLLGDGLSVRLISLFWLLTIVNAFNLVDVMDGLSSALGMLAGASIALGALAYGATGVGLLGAALAGALFGFFVYNAPPAKIYMGDAGSLCVGGLVGCSILALCNGAMSWPSILAIPFFAAVPLLELVCLIGIRTSLGIPFYHGSPHHFALYLQRKGWRKWGILAFAVCIQLFFATLAFGVIWCAVTPLWGAAAACFAALLFGLVVFLPKNPVGRGYSRRA